MPNLSTASIPRPRPYSVIQPDSHLPLQIMDGKRLLHFAGIVGAAQRSLHFAGRSLAFAAQGITHGYQAVANTVGRTLSFTPPQTATDTGTSSSSEPLSGDAGSAAVSSPLEKAPMGNTLQADSLRRPRRETAEEGVNRAAPEEAPHRRPAPAQRTGTS